MCRTPSETVVGARTDLTLHEISGHKTREDCWLIIDEKVYDVSDWISRHPGGEQILLMYAGTDATDVFKAFHHPREFKRLSAYHVGNLKHGEIHPSEGLKDFRKLNSELWEQGHFEPVLNFHYKIFAIAMSLMVACIMLLKIASMPTTSVASRYILVGTAGLCLAQFWQQSLLIAHDACHTGITRKRKVDVLLGQLFGTLGAGIGATWWTKDHNEHHAVTNQVERERGGDRTAGALPVLTVHELQLEWELRDQGKGARKGQQLWYWALLQLQYFLYAPIILIVARFNLHIISVVLAEKNMRLVLDMFLMAGFGVVTYGVCSMAPEGFRLGFYAVAHVSVSVLHMIIAMNHFHMPMYNEVYKPEDGGWLKHQLHTTSNISGGAFMNWYCGGLQCQVEHHLFPQMPRARLRSNDMGSSNGTNLFLCTNYADLMSAGTALTSENPGSFFHLQEQPML